MGRRRRWAWPSRAVVPLLTTSVAIGVLAASSCGKKSLPNASKGSDEKAPGAAESAGRLLVTNEDSGDITIIDLARGEVAATVAVGKRPRGIRVSPDQKLVFVA